jgi:hypothetical protein
MTPQWTIGDMIQKQQELKAFIEDEEAKLSEWLKPYKDARAAIEVACGVELQRQKLQNFKSDYGTAYLKGSDGLKVDNPASFLQFVRSQNAWNMLSIGLLVDPVREYWTKTQTEENPGGNLPPGISSTPSVTCIIRK